MNPIRSLSERSEEMKVTEELGVPLPVTDPHAVSVSLPKWDHVVGYEEGRSDVVQAMISGYPRFRIPTIVDGLFSVLRALYVLQPPTRQITEQRAREEKVPFLPKASLVCAVECMAFHGLSVAKRFKSFLLNGEVESVEVTFAKLSDDGVIAVFFPAALQPKAKRYWQHSGEVLTSRSAQEQLVNLEPLLLVASVPSSSLSNLFGETRVEKAWVALADPSKQLLEWVSDDALPISRPRSPLESILQHRIGEILFGDSLNREKESNILLTLSGMAAIFTAFRLIQRAFNNSHPHETLQTVVFGFPYLDTLKIMQRKEWNSGGVHFLGLGDEADLSQLEALLQSHVLDVPPPPPLPSTSFTFLNRIAAIFTEFPTNPLLRCPSLTRLRELCDRFGVVLVVDDTVGSFANVDLLQSAAAVDIQVASLTKIFSGTGNVMGGSLVLNAASQSYSYLAAELHKMQEELDLPWLHSGDLATLEENSRDYVARCSLVNQNTLALAEWLQKQPEVKLVYYPGLNGGNAEYKALMRLSVHGYGEPWQAGFGCLVSFDLKEDLVNVEAFYDSLAVNKGPSLGTNFTLVSPYTLLAHYMELPWAAQYDVPAKLIRVSVGLENAAETINIFQRALQAASASHSV